MTKQTDKTTVRQSQGAELVAAMKAKEVADAERVDISDEEARLERLAASTSWEPVRADALRDILRGGIDRPAPSMFKRDDGAALVYPGRTHLFIGETESLKTWAALVAIAQEIRAGNACLLFDMEDEPVTAVERLDQLGLSEDEIAEGLIYVSPSTPWDQVAWDHLDQRIGMSDRPVTLAVVDSMTEAMAAEGLDPDRGTDVSSFYHLLPVFLTNRHDMAVIIIDHVTKSHESRGRWAIGSERKVSGITGAALAFEVRTPFGRGMTGKVRVTISKDRPGSVRPSAVGKALGVMSFDSDPGTGAVSVSFASPSEDKGASLTDLARQVAETMNRLRADTWAVIDEDPGITSTRIRKLTTGDTETKGTALAELVGEGYVRVEKVGTSRHHFTVKSLPTAT